MRTEAEFLTQIALGEIPCALDREFCNTIRYLSQFERIHQTYEEYLRCVTRYVLNDMVKSTIEDRIREDYKSNLFVSARSYYPDVLATDSPVLKYLLRERRFLLATNMIKEVDRMFHANLEDILKAVIKDGRAGSRVNVD